MRTRHKKNRTRKTRKTIREKTPEKSPAESPPKSKIVLTKRSPNLKEKPHPEKLKKGNYYIIHSENPHRDLQGKFERYLANGSLAVFSKKVFQQKYDDIENEFYREETEKEYGIPVKNIVYIEKIGDPITYYRTKNLPEDLQREIDAYTGIGY